MEESFKRPPRVEIDLSAIKKNLGAIRRLVGERVKIMAVVKADAYGHGLVSVSRSLASEDVDCFGVFEMYEAVLLREAGIRKEICLMAGIRDREEAGLALKLDVTPVIVDLEMAEMLNFVASEHRKKIGCFLKVDTGMGRLGVFPQELKPILERFKGLSSLRLNGLFSHLSSADEPDPSFTLNQIRAFLEAIKTASQMGYNSMIHTLANSAGTLRFPHSHFDMVRIGLFLYGALPFNFPFGLSPEPAMTLKGEVLQIRYLPSHSPVSYCRTYRTTCPLKVAVVSVGYADGIHRGVSNRGYCLINGEEAPIIGYVCMNMTICNVEHIENVKRGDEVVFLGRQGEKTLRAELVAEWSGTIPYEILCSVGSRNERYYKG